MVELISVHGVTDSATIGSMLNVPRHFPAGTSPRGSVRDGRVGRNARGGPVRPRRAWTAIRRCGARCGAHRVLVPALGRGGYALQGASPGRGVSRSPANRRTDRANRLGSRRRGRGVSTRARAVPRLRRSFPPADSAFRRWWACRCGATDYSRGTRAAGLAAVRRRVRGGFLRRGACAGGRWRHGGVERALARGRTGDRRRATTGARPAHPGVGTSDARWRARRGRMGRWRCQELHRAHRSAFQTGDSERRGRAGRRGRRCALAQRGLLTHPRSLRRVSRAAPGGQHPGGHRLARGSGPRESAQDPDGRRGAQVPPTGGRGARDRRHAQLGDGHDPRSAVRILARRDRHLTRVVGRSPISTGIPESKRPLDPSTCSTSRCCTESRRPLSADDKKRTRRDLPVRHRDGGRREALPAPLRPGKCRRISCGTRVVPGCPLPNGGMWRCECRRDLPRDLERLFNGKLLFPVHQLPQRLVPIPPTLAIPSGTRLANRSSWCGRRGASVATTTMIEPSRSPSLRGNLSR